MKSVAIIGAGPGGLVAAKVLLRLYPQRFSVTVFEKQERVGGLWAVDTATHDKLLNPHMPTNLSKYTVAFSDLAWSSVDLEVHGSDSTRTKQTSQAPMFPKAWQVGRYLETYWRRYIPDNVVRFNCTVTHLEMVNQDQGGAKWLVRWNETVSQSSSQKREDVFDYAIVASGFCSSPLFPQPPREDKTQHPATTCPQIKHSSKVRSLADLVPRDWDGSGDIVVVGGTMSGVEAAASLAHDISNRRHAPGAAPFGAPRVIHVTPRPFYISPPYIPSDSSQSKPTFLPLDLVLYSLTRRPADATTAFFGRVPPEKARQTHEFLRSKVGGDHADLGAPALVSSSLEDAPYIAINTGSSYAEFVRAGHIVPMLGRIHEITPSDSSGSISQHLTATVSRQGSETQLLYIAGMVYATGYTPHAGLAFLSDDLKAKLEYDAHSHRLPLILTDCQTTCEALPGLAFIGLHEGTYWGVEECQARIIAAKWATPATSDTPSTPTTTPPPQDRDHERTTLRTLRAAMQAKAPDVPQLWNGDYVGLVEQCAHTQHASRTDTSWGGRAGPVFPARYLDSSSDAAEADTTARDLHATLARAQLDGGFVPRAAFAALQGAWTLRREVQSALAAAPSGVFVGVAAFEPRDVTDAAFDAEFLYIERGEFVMDNGATLAAARRYVYRYDGRRDCVSVWFVGEDGRSVEGLFLELAVQLEGRRMAGGGGGGGEGWLFTGHHLCEPDTYEAEHVFGFRGAALAEFATQYRVKGPHKDYVSTAQYQRESRGRPLAPW